MGDPADVDLEIGPTRVRVVVPALPIPSRLPVPGTPHARVVPVAGSTGAQGPAGADGTAAVDAHVVDATPHPAYDDMPSLNLLFENGLI